MMEQLEEQTQPEMAQQGELGEQPEERMQPEVAQQAEQLEILHHHHRIHHHLITEDQGEDTCSDDKVESKNWNSQNLLKFRNQRGSKGKPGDNFDTWWVLVQVYIEGQPEKFPKDNRTSD